MADVNLKQVRSANGASESQRATLRSLKLGRIGREAKHPDSPQLQGMIRAVSHLVEVENG
ncbi:MAG TPA: 50S ribosomal protein L30 [Solirubrobacterales bacterium]|jgi:large subunit ribosomal protein L30|nr:50S ribosomal protein L30 [Solirubrobacterales bacterium]